MSIRTKYKWDGFSAKPNRFIQSNDWSLISGDETIKLIRLIYPNNYCKLYNYYLDIEIWLHYNTNGMGIYIEQYYRKFDFDLLSIWFIKL